MHESIGVTDVKILRTRKSWFSIGPHCSCMVRAVQNPTLHCRFPVEADDARIGCGADLTCG